MLKSFTKKLLRWHESNKRDLPWKKTNDPYSIWLSEIILQQTRVKQGSPYYDRILKKFPTVERLANASEDEVLKMWEGLGYYSRARNLKFAAQQILKDFQGKFPATYDDILKLKGIGPYTAAAIASFAFDLPHAVVDGNVQRVLSRYFGIRETIDSTPGKKVFNDLAQKLLDKKLPGEYNQAIMNFGALVCKPATPDCKTCIFIKDCFAFRHQCIAELPARQKKINIRKRWFYYFVLQNDNYVAIEKRSGNDIWKGLYQFPLIETKSFCDVKELKHAFRRMKIISPYKIEASGISGVIEHKLTHQIIFTQFVRFNISEGEVAALQTPLMVVEKNNLSKYGFPKVIDNYIKNYLY